MHAVHASLIPTANDLAGLLAYVLGNPYLFISSSTVMTTGLLIGAVGLGHATHRVSAAPCRTPTGDGPRLFRTRKHRARDRDPHPLPRAGTRRDRDAIRFGDRVSSRRRSGSRSSCRI